MLASLRETDRPRPVPRTPSRLSLSIWANSSKTRSWCSGAMPMPVSLTMKATVSFGPDFTATRTSPRSVNLRAFETRLRRIWLTLGSSVWSSGMPSGGSSTQSSTPSHLGSARMVPRSAARTERAANRVGRSETLPASILERSSTSSMRPRRVSALVRMNSICVSCSDVRSPSVRSRSRRERPRMELIGVRNSWLTLATRRVLTSADRRRVSFFSSSSACRLLSPSLGSAS